MKTKKKIVIGIVMLAMLGVILGLVGCDDGPPTVDQKQASQQENILNQANTQLGMPNISNFQEKKMMKQIMELCDKSNLVCYVYTFSQMTGKYNFLGESIGFGLPYGTEYTNPQRIAASESQVGYAILPQADPNGLFKPADVHATWICMIDPKTGEKYIVYSEPDMTISEHKLPKYMLNQGGYPSNY